MGRYYDGDIEGKFWFGIQSSDDADFFGVTGIQPQDLQYEFYEDNLEGVEKGIKQCENELCNYEKMLDDFFDKHNGYQMEELADFLHVSVDKTEELLAVYARLHLGRKIAKCIKETGQCCFTAEV